MPAAGEHEPAHEVQAVSTTSRDDPPAEGDGLFGGLAVLGGRGVGVLERGQLGGQPHAQLRVQLCEGNLRERLVEDLQRCAGTAVNSWRCGEDCQQSAGSM